MASRSAGKETVLYVVRHGETEWNTRGIQQGHLDSPLTATGVRQARGVAKGLVGRGIDAIFSSDLGRARTTADIIAKEIGFEVVDDKRLRERNLGTIEGMTQEDFRLRYPEEFASYKSRDPEYAFPGGEGTTEFYQRSINGCNSIAEKNSGHTILLVTHGGVLGALMTYVLDLGVGSVRRFSLYNAAINRFIVRRDEWRLDTWGEVSHLEQTIDDR